MQNSEFLIWFHVNSKDLNESDLATEFENGKLKIYCNSKKFKTQEHN